MRDVSVHVMEGDGVFDTVENRTRLPSALCNAHRHITQCVGIVMGGGGGGGGGGYLTCWGTVGSRDRCSHHEVCEGGVAPERELGRGWKDGGKRWIILYEGPVLM